MATQDKKIGFHVDVSWDGNGSGSVVFSNGSVLHVDIPREFGGEGMYLCPDELFFSSVGSCLLTTFLAMQKKLRFQTECVQIRVDGDVRSFGSDGYRITAIRVNLSVKIHKEEKDKAENCIELTKRFCHITRSIEESIRTEFSTDIIAT